MTMNLQKILHSYKHWEDYNKQHDIGLMTLYHHQEAGKTTSCAEAQPLRLFEIQERTKEMPDESQVEAQLLAGKSTRREGTTFDRGRLAAISSKRAEDSLLMRKQGTKCKHKPHLVLPINSRKEGIRLGYYDVTQMSNLQIQRRLNEMPPLIERFIKQKRVATSQTENHTSTTCHLERSLKLMSERKGPCQSPAKMIIKAAQELTKQDSWLQATKEKSPKKLIKTQRLTNPINYIDYKLISYCKTKIKEKGKDFRKSFKKDMQRQSQRYTTDFDSPPCGKKTGKILNDLNLLKLRMHSRTLISGQAANDKLQEVISGYFTPVSLHRDNKHSESL